MALGNNWTNIASRKVARGQAEVTFWIDVKLNRQDTVGNYSVVDTRLTSTISGALSGTRYNFTLTGANGISGTTVWTFENETILTGQTTIYHNDDGTKIGSASAYCYNGYWNINESFSGSFELPTIARASIPSISPSSTFNIGDTITINTNRKSTLFTHTMSLTLGSYTYQLGTNITDSVTLDTSTIANNLYQQITTAPQGTGTITCITYNGTTQIGTKTSSFVAKVTNSNPTFNVAYQDTNSTTTTITNNNQQIIRNNSTLQINISNASAKNYAALSSLSAIIEGTTYAGSLNGTSGTINVGTLNFSSNVVAQVILTDSRGISTTTNVTITILDWTLPTGIITLGRQNNFYSETDIKVDANYSSLDNKNAITIKVRTKKTTSSTYGSYTTLSDNVTSTLTLDNEYAWDVQVLVQDKIGSKTYNLSIGRGIPIVFFDRLKRAVGINCFPQNDNSIEVLGADVLKVLGTKVDTFIAGNIYPIGSLVAYKRKLYKSLTGIALNPPDTDTTNWSETSFLNNMYIGEKYSESEIIIGSWTDAKPIYRKVLSANSLANDGTLTINHGITNLSKVIKVTFSWYDTNDQRWFEGIRYDSGSVYVKLGGVSSTNVYLNCKGTNWSARTSDVSVVLEYTKT